MVLSVELEMFLIIIFYPLIQFNQILLLVILLSLPHPWIVSILLWCCQCVWIIYNPPSNNVELITIFLCTLRNLYTPYKTQRFKDFFTSILYIFTRKLIPLPQTILIVSHYTYRKLDRRPAVVYWTSVSQSISFQLNHCSFRQWNNITDITKITLNTVPIVNHPQQQGFSQCKVLPRDWPCDRPMALIM